jgi:sensor histidine kinase regulating citrate/malate metabolism
MNLLKNGLEASLEEEKVTIGCTKTEENIRFWVHNLSLMSEKVKMQVFQRSFSTKGRGRGIGTYSVKLLGENYLKGKVSFTSEVGQGTTFFIDLPREI